MAEQSTNGARVSRATVAKLQNTVEMTCRPGPSAKLDAHNSGLSIPVGNSLAEGTRHYTGLQELLLGFTSGALCLISNQDGHLVQGMQMISLIKSLASMLAVRSDCSSQCTASTPENDQRRNY